MGSRAFGVGSDFVIDDGTRKNTGDGGWCHAVGPTTCEAGFLLFTKSGEISVGFLWRNSPDEEVFGWLGIA
ncbi:hypothetical protein CCT19_26945 [Escherichia coli]|nr:hypothetical protein [Escherichia coli]